MHQAMIMQIERQRLEEAELELRQLAKLGVEPDRVRMLEPGVYVEVEDDEESDREEEEDDDDDDGGFCD